MGAIPLAAFGNYESYKRMKQNESQGISETVDGFPNINKHPADINDSNSGKPREQLAIRQFGTADLIIDSSHSGGEILQVSGVCNNGMQTPHYHVKGLDGTPKNFTVLFKDAREAPMTKYKKAYSGFSNDAARVVEKFAERHNMDLDRALATLNALHMDPAMSPLTEKEEEIPELPAAPKGYQGPLQWVNSQAAENEPEHPFINPFSEKEGNSPEASAAQTEELADTLRKAPYWGGLEEKPETSAAHLKFKEELNTILSETESLLTEKNLAYGDSALNPVGIFQKNVSVKYGLGVRIDDKLSRIMRGNSYPGDNDIDDLIGYLILLKIAIRREDQVDGQ